MTSPYGGDISQVYARAGFGAPVRRGARPAVIVVDLTNGFTDPASPAGAPLDDVVAAVNRLAGAARAAGAPVIFTAIAYTPPEADGDAVAWLAKARGMRDMREGSSAVALDSRLQVSIRDHVITKKGASAFFGKSLSALLAGLRADTLLVCGATTSGCVRATVVDAVQSGFSVLVPRQCVGDRAAGPQEANLFDIQEKYGDVVELADAIGYLESLATPASQRPAESRLVSQAALADLADVPATSCWVRSGSVRLHLLDYGGDGAPMLVLPGITSPAIAMDFVARGLTDLVRPIVLDVRGRGLSDSGRSYMLDDYAADTAAVIAALGLECPLLLGHSMGARIAAVVAVRGPQTRGTILVDPPMSGPGRDPYPTPLSAFLGQLAQAQRGTTAEEVALSWPRWPRREQELRARWLSSCDAAAIEATHRGFEAEDFFTTWPAVPGPATLIYGSDSPVVTAAGAAEASAANPAAQLVSVPGAGHMVFWDTPDAALRALRAAIACITE